MAAYVIVDIDVFDPEGYQEYIRLAPATVTESGGRYLVRGGKTEILEGDWQPKRFVVLQFDDIEQAKAWWSSAAYAPIMAIRHRTARTNMIVVEGVKG